jgi:SWI/SNF-related matrix-associated actin-dependent regulator 1 of chromatin subfamily A
MIDDDFIETFFKFGTGIEVPVHNQARNMIVRKALVTPEKRAFYVSNSYALGRMGVRLGPKYRGQPGEEEFAWWRPVPEEITQERKAIVELSMAADADFDVPRPNGVEFRGYQRAGIKLLSSRPASYLGDEMGLGKTAQVVGWVNLNPGWNDILIICPLRVRDGWVDNFARFGIHRRSIAFAEDGVWPSSQVVIVHYEAVHRFRHQLHTRVWDLVVLDEGHMLRNRKTKRARMLLGGRADHKKGIPAEAGLSAKHRVVLTGTPMANVPMDLFPLLRWLNKDVWGNYTEFFNRYGITNEHHAELHRKLRETVMIRRLKADVASDLPPKVRQIVPIQPTTPEQLRVVERDLALIGSRGKELDELISMQELDNRVQANLMSFLKVSIQEIAAIRQETAKAILEDGIAFVREMLEEVGKVILFAHHQAIIDRLFEAFSDVGSARVRGGIHPDESRRAFQRFANDPTCRVLAASILSTGTGVDGLQSNCSHAVFFEDDWVPGSMAQAEDRLHRLGQKDTVFSYHLALNGSIGVRILKVNVEKQKIMDVILDGVEAPKEPIAAKAEIPPARHPFGRRWKPGRVVAQQFKLPGI